MVISKNVWRLLACVAANYQGGMRVFTFTEPHWHYVSSYLNIEIYGERQNYGVLDG